MYSGTHAEATSFQVTICREKYILNTELSADQVSGQSGCQRSLSVPKDMLKDLLIWEKKSVLFWTLDY